MDRTSFAGTAVVCGAACVFIGAGLGVAVAASAVAYADDSSDFVPVPPFPSTTGNFPVFDPAAYQGEPTNVVTVSQPDYYSVTENYHYVLPYAFPPPTNPTGSYDTTYQQQIFDTGFTDYQNAVEKVTDSSGVAPAVGTTWDGSTLGIAIPTGNVEEPGIGTELYTNYSMTTPTGAFADDFVLTDLAYANQFYAGPKGIFDYLVDLNSGFGPVAPIPIIDIPFTAAGATAAESGSLWSDLLPTL